MGIGSTESKGTDSRTTTASNLPIDDLVLAMWRNVVKVARTCFQKVWLMDTILQRLVDTLSSFSCDDVRWGFHTSYEVQDFHKSILPSQIMCNKKTLPSFRRTWDCQCTYKYHDLVSWEMFWSIFQVDEMVLACKFQDQMEARRQNRPWNSCRMKSTAVRKLQYHP